MNVNDCLAYALKGQKENYALYKSRQKKRTANYELKYFFAMRFDKTPRFVADNYIRPECWV